MNLEDIYRYILNPKNLSPNLEKVPEEKKERRIKEFNARLKTVFGSTPEYLKNSFYFFLKKFGSEDLWNIVFPDTPSDYSYGSVPIPDDAEILRSYNSLNNKYNYFASTDKTTQNHYLNLYKTAVIFNTFMGISYDQELFTQVYKLIVLVGISSNLTPFIPIDNYLQAYHKTKNPIHDSTVREIQSLSKPINITIWNDLVRKYGPRAVNLFQRIDDIEKNLHRAPKSIEEAESCAANLKYANASRHPDMAKFAQQNNINEETFNHALGLFEKRKKEENLPRVVIDGSKIGHKSFFLLNLPYNDFRGAFLGNITNCCQSIGGDSMLCVHNGIKLKNNGFYVLLKDISKKKNAKLFIDEQAQTINHNDFRIIGQCYAWFSKHNNLVLDSWENLRSEDNDLAIDMLIEFGKVITNENREIFQIKLGGGGKSPTDKLLRAKSESMKEGYQYPDSRKQYLIFRDEEKVNNEMKEIENIVHSIQKEGLIDADTSKELLESIKEFMSDYPDALIKINLGTIFLDKVYLSFWKSIVDKNPNYIKQLLIHDNYFNFSGLQLLQILGKYNSLTQNLIDSLTTNEVNYLALLEYLDNEKMLNQELITTILKDKIDALFNGGSIDNPACPLVQIIEQLQLAGVLKESFGKFYVFAKEKPKEFDDYFFENRELMMVLNMADALNSKSLSLISDNFSLGKKVLKSAIAAYHYNFLDDSMLELIYYYFSSHDTQQTLSSEPMGNLIIKMHSLGFRDKKYIIDLLSHKEDVDYFLNILSLFTTANFTHFREEKNNWEVVSLASHINLWDLILKSLPHKNTIESILRIESEYELFVIDEDNEEERAMVSASLINLLTNADKANNYLNLLEILETNELLNSNTAFMVLNESHLQDINVDRILENKSYLSKLKEASPVSSRSYVTPGTVDHAAKQFIIYCEKNLHRSRSEIIKGWVKDYQDRFNSSPFQCISELSNRSLFKPKIDLRELVELFLDDKTILDDLQKYNLQ